MNQKGFLIRLGNKINSLLNSFNCRRFLTSEVNHKGKVQNKKGYL
jgi:hypothetical protein